MFPTPRIFFQLFGVTLAALTSAFGWTPGTLPVSPQRMDTSGFTLNSQDRVDVISFWHAVYLASEGYETRVNWTGNYSGNNGSVGDAFVDDVERRINYFRAMSGLSANVGVNLGSRVSILPGDLFTPDPQTLKVTAAQATALMLVRNYNPVTGANLANSHSPLNTLIGWSPAAWNAAARGNLAFGLYGPGAMTEYLVERFGNSTAGSSWNVNVGHRRWILYSEATDFATGDQPGLGVNMPPTNVLYVMQNPAELIFTGNTNFVTYPPSGFVPAELNSPFWSLSKPGADFSTASVQMTDSNGVIVPISDLRTNSEFGDPALIWTLNPSSVIRSVSADMRFNVTVTGIAGAGVPTSHSYSVTLINPKQLVQPANESMTPGVSHIIDGPSTLAPAATQAFSFTPLAAAEALEVGTFVKVTAPWKETAEVANLANVTRGASAAYSFFANPASFPGFGVLTGVSAFRLTLPFQVDPLTRAVPEQSFEVNRDIIPEPAVAARATTYYRKNPYSTSGRDLAGPVIPAAEASLSFQFRRGYMTPSTFLAVEASTDGGSSWSVLGSLISGLSTTRVDTLATTATRALPLSSSPIRVRFRLFWRSSGAPGENYFIHKGAETFPTGIFIDEITTTNCSELQAKAVTTLVPNATQFTFSEASAGSPLVNGSEWSLRLRTRLAGTWFQYGPPKTVTISTP